MGWREGLSVTEETVSAMMLTDAQQDEIARGLVARARAEGAELVGRRKPGQAPLEPLVCLISTGCPQFGRYRYSQLSVERGSGRLRRDGHE